MQDHGTHHAKLHWDPRQSPAWGTQPLGPRSSFPRLNKPSACPDGTSQPANMDMCSRQLLPRGSVQTGLVQCSELIHSYPSACEFAATSVSWFGYPTALWHSPSVGCVPSYLTLQSMFKPCIAHRNWYAKAFTRNVFWKVCAMPYLQFEAFLQLLVAN